MPVDLDRRRLLTGLGGLLLGAGCVDDRNRNRSVTSPEMAAGGPLPFNVHPLGGRFETLQRQALVNLGTSWIRVTLGLVNDVDAARPYVRSAPNTLGLVSDFRLGPIDPGQWPDLVEATGRGRWGRAEVGDQPEGIGRRAHVGPRRVHVVDETEGDADPRRAQVDERLARSVSNRPPAGGR